MPFNPPIEEVKKAYPEYTFVTALTPSEQKAAFHVRDDQGRDYCLKLIAPSYDLDRLNREIHALRSISHPHVASLKEYVLISTKDGERHHLLEDFIDGSDLNDSLGTPWIAQDAAHYFGGLCSGLEELRKARVVHRDLKPSNIRRKPDGTFVIIDFGLARHLDLPDITQTQDGAAIGTPIYFAPEQFQGNKYDIDHRTDLFALGILLYEALVGEHPFLDGKPSTISQVRDAICSSERHLQNSRFLALERPWQILLSKLLQKQRSNRPASAGQVQAILDKISAP